MSSNVNEIREQVRELELELRQLETRVNRSISLLTSAMALTRRFSGHESVDEAMGKFQRLITLLYGLRTAYTALQAVRMAAGDPLAWLTFGVSLGVTAASAGDFYMEWNSR